MADPALIMAAIVGIGAAAGLAYNVAVALVSLKPKVKTLMAKTIADYLLSPAGLAVISWGLNVVENAAEAATTDPALKSLEVVAFQVVNDKVAALATPAPAPVPAPAPTPA